MNKKASSAPTFAHREADEVAELFSRRFSPVLIKPQGRDGPVDMTGTHGRLPGTDFNETDFGTGFQIVPQQKDVSYFFLFPTEGAASVGMGRTTVEANAGFATASYGLTMDSVQFVSGLRKTALSIEKELVNDRLSRLMDGAVTTDVVFEPVVDQQSGRIPSLVSYVSFLSGSEFGRMIDDTPFASRQMANTLVDLFLEVWPHNFSEVLLPPIVSVAPRHVKRAVEYFHAHPHAEIAVEQLADVCGVSARALQYGFRNFLGMSIGQYERQMRLEGARRTMIDQPELTVADIAKLWNFSNVHRFSVQFRQAFGRLPSEFRHKRRL